MIPCPHALEDLNAYIDGELPPEERRSLCLHLETCISCQRSTQTLMTVKEMVTRTAAVYPLPPTLRADLPLSSLPSRRTSYSLLALFRRWAFFRRP